MSLVGERIVSRLALRVNLATRGKAQAQSGSSDQFQGRKDGGLRPTEAVELARLAEFHSLPMPAFGQLNFLEGFLETKHCSFSGVFKR